MQYSQRHFLIGRDRELEQLAAAAAEARAGRGALYLVTGESGIGKTRLAEELSERAEQDGMVSIWGRCWENPGSPAYWPWTQALRALFEHRDVSTLQRELGGGADWIAEIVPELRRRVSGIEPLGSLRSEQARFALFDAVSTLLHNVGTSVPLLIVLDDLHAADRESLAMLDFIVRSLAEAPMMIVAAYQDAAVRARLEVEKLFGSLGIRGRHIVLGGIAEEEVGKIVEQQIGAAPPPELVHALYETTEGNPFFAGEVTRLLATQGQLAVWAKGEQRGRLPFPDTVRETVRRRLQPLGRAGIDMLKAAAVVGREFRLTTLERLPCSDSESLVTLLDETRAAGLIVEVPDAIGRFRFTHGLIRETLYSELTTAEHIRLHREVGQALEEVHGEDPEHLAELAHHFAEAALGRDADRALEYASRAGQEAMRVLAYERAAQLFELALEIGNQLPFDLERHTDLLLSLGIARTRADDPSARETLLAAAEAARSANRADLLALAALGIHVFNITPGVPDDVSIGLLEEALERVGTEDSVLRARLLARIATALYYRFGTAERREALVTEAVSMARRLDDAATLAYVLINGQLATWGPDTTERDLDWVEELLVLTEEAGNAELALQTRTRQIDYLLELDDLVGADIALLALERTAEESPDPRSQAYLPLQKARRAALEGRYEEAERYNAEAASVGTSLDDRMLQLLAGAQLAMLHWTQGRIGEVEELIRRFADGAPGIVGWRAALARTYCDLGRESEARRELERLDQRGFANLPRYNGWLNMMALLSEVCAHLGDAERAAALYELLLPFERRNIVTAQCVFDGPASRYLGIMAATFGDWDAAARHFELSHRASTRLNARPFLALGKLDEAQMLTGRDRSVDRARALGLLNEGREIAVTLGMDKVVERADRLRQTMGDVEAVAVDERPAPEPASATAHVRREGDVWAFDFEGQVVRVRHTKGVQYLTTLLANPGVEIHSLELAGGLSDGAGGNVSERTPELSVGGDDAGPVFDSQAKRAYRTRLEDLREELEEAESLNDPERVARARLEMDFIARELAGAVGLGGRDRRSASNAERARVSVTKVIRATMRRIGEMSSDLGHELEATIRTGTFCAYEPDRRRPISWQVERE